MSYRAINATTVTLLDLLTSRFVADPLLRPFFDSGAGGSMVLSARTPQEMADSNEAGLSVWLYRIARDPELLNQPPRRVAADAYEYRPLPLRLHYLMTPVVNDPEVSGNDPGMEQFIIGKVLQSLHDTPVLHGALLGGDLAGSGSRLTVRLEPMDLEEITRVWDAMESSYQLCISYEVSLVLIASNQAAEHLGPVLSVEPEYGVITEVNS
ncbi:DUF4255 domain-containing protein [Mangrovimicrobium sediminis]|uniref:DUF4255 domain-containing protein n=1 Tax=Mangrovimicrobium sediminis TaxID=2562682 RepID=UPI001436C369|nr:DUF4255 domain-containing protein [Haliea sp. SAOS-164]